MFGGPAFNIHTNLYYDTLQIKILEKIVKHKIYEVISFKISICNNLSPDKCISSDYVEDNLTIIFRKKRKEGREEEKEE